MCASCHIFPSPRSLSLSSQTFWEMRRRLDTPTLAAGGLSCRDGGFKSLWSLWSLHKAGAYEAKHTLNNTDVCVDIYETYVTQCSRPHKAQEENTDVCV